jgi:hypothetical protein
MGCVEIESTDNSRSRKQPYTSIKTAKYHQHHCYNGRRGCLLCGFTSHNAAYQHVAFVDSWPCNVVTAKVTARKAKAKAATSATAPMHFNLLNNNGNNNNDNSKFITTISTGTTNHLQAGCY